MLIRSYLLLPEFVVERFIPIAFQYSLEYDIRKFKEIGKDCS